MSDQSSKEATVLSTEQPLLSTSKSVSDMFLTLDPLPPNNVEDTINLSEIRSELDLVFSINNTENSLDLHGKKLQLYGVLESPEDVFTGRILFLFHIQYNDLKSNNILSF